MTLLAVASIPLFWQDRYSPFAFYYPIPWAVSWLTGLLAYAVRPMWSLPCGFVICLSYIIPHRSFVLALDPMIPDIDCMMECVAAFAVGYALRLSGQLRDQARLEREAAELRADSARLKHVRSNAALQRVIHDSVANELTYIALLTRPSYQSLNAKIIADRNANHENDRGNDVHGMSDTRIAEDPRIPIIHDHVASALAHTRQAIELLTMPAITDPSDTPCDDQRDEKPSSGPNVVSFRNADADGSDPLSEFVRQRDEDLHALGFRGETRIVMTPTATRDGIDALMRDQDLLSLFREVYGNIAAHGQANGGWFSVMVTIGEHELRVQSDNDVAPSRDADVLLHSGIGLSRQREYVQRCGGALDTFLCNDVFSVFVELPVKQSDAVPEQVSHRRHA